MAELLDPIEIDLRDGALPAGQVQPITATDARSALGWLRQGVHDETIRLELPPSVRSTLSPIITAVRWGALLLGMIFAVPLAVNEGSLRAVAALAVVLFLTIWRTFRPLRLAWDGVTDRLLPLTDGIIVGAAAGLTGGFDSPFIYSVLAVVVIAAIGWAYLMGLAALGSSLFSMLMVGVIGGAGFNLDDRRAFVMLVAMVLSGAVLAFARNRLLEVEAQRQARTGQLNVLSETNDLLGILNQVTSALPASLDMREALGATRAQLIEAFDAQTVGLLTRDEANNSWVPQISEGTALPQSIKTPDLPRMLSQALLRNSAIHRSNPGPEGLNGRSKSGLYTPLVSRGSVVGLLAIETEVPNRYGAREQRLIEGLAEALGLTLDNARQFGKLRAIGADDERARIARDLHDRLAQWLTYVGFELQRIMQNGGTPEPSLSALHSDVQGAIEELRETLRQLQAEVSADEPLALAIDAVLARFEERTKIKTRYYNRSGGSALSVHVENELLHIFQEALNNVGKHSDATEVKVSWKITGKTGLLEVVDNGKGFNTRTQRTDSSFGLVTMRERADILDAAFDVTSRPNRGTTVSVTVTEPSEIVLL